MKQSRVMSLVEAIANVIVGYGLAVLTQTLIFPVFGLHTTLVQNLMMGAVFTLVSIARSFVLRRLFEARRFEKIAWLQRFSSFRHHAHFEKPQPAGLLARAMPATSRKRSCRLRLPRSL